MNDFPQTALPLLSTDHAASALSSELAAPPHLRPHAGASELGQLTDDRLEAILRVDALADPVHDRVRDTLAAVFPRRPNGRAARRGASRPVHTGNSACRRRARGKPTRRRPCARQAVELSAQPKAFARI